MDVVLVYSCLLYTSIIGANQTMGKAGFLRQTFGSEDVKWETTKSSNLGIDMSIYRKLNFKLDLWHRITSDMLYPCLLYTSRCV